MRDPYNDPHYTTLDHKEYHPLPYVIDYLFSRLIDINFWNDLNYYLPMWKEPILLIFYLFYLLFFVIILFDSIKNALNGIPRILKSVIAFCFIFSLPLIYTYERGNILIVAGALTMYFVTNYRSDSPLERHLSSFALAFAAGIKLTPALFGLLLLFDKRWKQAVTTIIYGLLLFFCPFLFFKGGMANFGYMLRNMGLAVSHSQFFTLKEILDNINVHIPRETGVAISFALMALVLLSAFFQEKQWKQALSVAVCVVCLVPVSASYTSIFFIPPAVLFLNEEKHEKYDFLVLFCFILLFHIYKFNFSGIKINNQFGALLLLFIVLLNNAVKLISYINNNNFTIIYNEQ